MRVFFGASSAEPTVHHAQLSMGVYQMDLALHLDAPVSCHQCVHQERDLRLVVGATQNWGSNVSMDHEKQNRGGGVPGSTPLDMPQALEQHTRTN